MCSLSPFLPVIQTSENRWAPEGHLWVLEFSNKKPRSSRRNAATSALKWTGVPYPVLQLLMSDSQEDETQQDWNSSARKTRREKANRTSINQRANKCCALRRCPTPTHTRPVYSCRFVIHDFEWPHPDIGGLCSSWKFSFTGQTSSEKGFWQQNNCLSTLYIGLARKNVSTEK